MSAISPRAIILLIVIMVGVGVCEARAQTQQLESQFGDGTDGGLVPDSGTLSGGQPEQLLEQLGIAPQQAQQLRNQSVGGAISNSELQRLCVSIAAKHLGPEDAQAIGRRLELSDDEVNQLVQCAQRSYGTTQRSTTPSATGVSEPSAIEERFHAADTPYRLLAAPNVTRLKQFGYELFSSTQEPQLTEFENVPVGPDYIIGPGDELNLLLWGRVNRNLKLLVQRDGTVLIPQMGPLSVAGLRFDQAQKLIISQAQQIEGVQADVTMGRLRTINILVIGQVDHPGLQNVSALAHVSDALLAAGGVSKTGSLRHIELRRDNRIVAVLDLYSMLLYGDTSGDERLEPRDVIFVPVIGAVVGVAGNVKNPAIYELNSRATLAGVVKMAGGVSAFGYAQRIEVERVQNHSQRIVLDVGLNNAQARSFPVEDGDLIKIFPVLPDENNVVKLEGNVSRPGSYQWRSGMRVSDLIRYGQGVRDHTVFDYALLERRHGRKRTIEYLPVNLGEAISDELSAANFDLLMGDTLTVYSVGEVNEIPMATVGGEVRKPGRYPLTEGMRVRDLIYEAGGLKQDAYLDKAQLARTESNGSRALQIHRDLDLRTALDNGPDNVTLSNGDALYIAQASNWHNPWTITVKGEVMRPGPYVISQDATLDSALIRAGGIRADGFLPALILLRRSVLEMQRQSLRRTSAQLQTELTRAALMPPENPQQEQSNLQQKTEALNMLKGMIMQNEESQAIGRVVLNISSRVAIPDLSSVTLENGDDIIIPRRPTTVNVMGQVYGATAVAYDPALTVADYLDRAGGITRDAEKDAIFVVRANGEILSEESFQDRDTNRLFPFLPVISGGFMATRLGPGDTIYVPPSLLFVNPLQRTLSVTQIIANAAQGLAIVGLLATQI
jgi:protein involved in polysaccharide export with SLBB domain